jgi:hypothetical protein
MGDYGSVQRMGEVESVKPARPALPKFIAPVLVLILAGCACVLVSSLYRADNQMSQVVPDPADAARMRAGEKRVH